MTTKPAPSGLVIAPDGGTTYALGASRLQWKVSGDQTGGAYALAEFVIAPGGGAGRHVHHAEDEGWSIVEGAVEFELGDQQIRAEAGAYVFIPRGLFHAFKNTGATPARALMIVTPAGLERYFAELDALIKQHSAGPPAAEIAALNVKYQLEFTKT